MQGDKHRGMGKAGLGNVLKGSERLSHDLLLLRALHVNVLKCIHLLSVASKVCTKGPLIRISTHHGAVSHSRNVRGSISKQLRNRSIHCVTHFRLHYALIPRTYHHLPCYNTNYTRARPLATFTFTFRQISFDSIKHLPLSEKNYSHSIGLRQPWAVDHFLFIYHPRCFKLQEQQSTMPSFHVYMRRWVPLGSPKRAQLLTG